MGTVIPLCSVFPPVFRASWGLAWTRPQTHAHDLLTAGMALDLRPFMQRTPFVLQGNASLARAYRLFRTMGLHHLYVGPPKPRVIGLLTRKVSLLCPCHSLMQP